MLEILLLIYVSEKEFRVQINGVVRARVTIKTIVVGGTTVEARIAGVLRGEL
jgi:hypothetical protein